MRRALALALALAVALAPACRVQRGRRAASAAERPELAALGLRPPEGWREASAYAFEPLALAWPGEEAPARLEAESLAELRAALGGADVELAVRAAVLLARSGDPAAGLALLEQLERRLPHPERHTDAAEVVAAAALAGWEVAPDAAARLAALADGPGEHPDLEVRVECAASALAAGRREVVPFLLRVLHAGTPAELEDPIDWPPTTTLFWAKSRASDALARAAGLPNDFRPDASYADQLAAARSFERALGSAR